MIVYDPIRLKIQQLNELSYIVEKSLNRIDQLMSQNNAYFGDERSSCVSSLYRSIRENIVGLKKFIDEMSSDLETEYKAYEDAEAVAASSLAKFFM